MHFHSFVFTEEGGEFLETAWVDHFSTQWTEIKNLEPEVYEFKTVGKNTVGTSPESDVTEARPEQGPPIIGKHQEAFNTPHLKDVTNVSTQGRNVGNQELKLRRAAHDNIEWCRGKRGGGRVVGS